MVESPSWMVEHARAERDRLRQQRTVARDAPFEIGPLTVADLRAAALAVNCPPMTNNAVLAVQLKRLGEQLAAAGEGARLTVEKPK